MNKFWLIIVTIGSCIVGYVSSLFGNNPTITGGVFAFCVTWFSIDRSKEWRNDGDSMQYIIFMTIFVSLFYWAWELLKGIL